MGNAGVASPCGDAVDAAEQGTDIEQKRLRERWKWPHWGCSQTDAVVVLKMPRLQRQLPRRRPPAAVVAVVDVDAVVVLIFPWADLTLV